MARQVALINLLRQLVGVVAAAGGFGVKQQRIGQRQARIVRIFAPARIKGPQQRNVAACTVGATLAISERIDLNDNDFALKRTPTE